MNATIVHKSTVKGDVLDALAKGLPGVIADTLEVAGGKVAILKPEQVSLEFTQASPRDIGSDIKVMIFARSIFPRSSKEKNLAQEILDKVIALTHMSGGDYSVNVRLYLMEVGAAEYRPQA